MQCKKTRPRYGMSKCLCLSRMGDTSLVSPELCLLDEDESDLNEHTLDPTDPVVCLPDQDDPDDWVQRRSAHE